MRADTAPLPEISLVDLTKQYREVRAVDRVSLDVAVGEFFSLLGPSGCGKTTTLRMIGGFEQPTAGRIELRGRDVTNDPPERRPVNMVFQNYALFPHLNVFDNVAFGLRRHHVESGEVRQRVGEALELVRLTGLDKRAPDHLSGGQQQRVALARALVCRPTVLLLDEPLGALDLKLRKQLQVELKRIQAEVGITFVYVTHDQEEALTLSDRIAVMRAGRVEQLGTPEELYDRPRTRFVADFVGTTNLLAGRWRRSPGRTPSSSSRAGERCLAARRRACSPAGGRAVHPPRGASSCVPPVGPADAAPMQPPVLRGRVEQSAYLGTSIRYLVRTAGGLPVTAFVPRAARRLAQGDAVEIRWPPTAALALARSPEDHEEDRS